MCVCVSSNEFEWWSIYSAATFKQIYIYINCVLPEKHGSGGTDSGHRLSSLGGP